MSPSFKPSTFVSVTILLYVISTVLIIPGDGARILFFFPSGTFSHKQSVWPQVTGLADKGHNVTFISSYGKKPYDHPNVTDLKSTSSANLMKIFYGNKDRLEDRRQGVERTMWKNYINSTIRVCEAIFKNKPGQSDDPDLHRVLYEEEYDLVVNNLVLGDCGLIVAYQKRAKLIISMSSPLETFLHDEFGFPAETAWIPEISAGHTFPMGFIDRVNNFLAPIKWYLARQSVLYPALERIMKEAYGLKDEEVPSLFKVQQSASLIMSHAHFTTEFPRSLPPMLINVGAMQCWLPTQPLEGDLKAVLDKATKGVILIAFGSTINLAKMPQNYKDMFIDTIHSFPEITFIWKWDGPLPPNQPKNLVNSKWLPQNEILAHPNVKAFITHAGLNSITETTFQGVPVILLPLFGDQDYNSYRVEALEIGIRLEARELSTEIMVNSVNQILTNPKYAKNIKTISAIMRDQPLNPIETAVYWTEFVLRHDDTSSLKPLQNHSWFIRRHFDIFFVLLVICSTVISGFFLAIFFLIRKMLFTCSGVSNVKSKTN